MELIEQKRRGAEGEEVQGEGEVEHQQDEPAGETGFLGLAETSAASSFPFRLVAWSTAFPSTLDTMNNYTFRFVYTPCHFPVSD